MTVEPRDLDLGTLALFVGSAAAAAVQEELAAQGFAGLRVSHGYVFQHLVEEGRTIGELAGRMEVTQQAASKVVGELEGLGYVERVPDPRDARVRRVRLSRRGREAVAAARRARAAQEERLAELGGRARVEECRALLAELLGELGGAGAVRRREVRPPR
ncbi:MarR family winged helix-turn-helix transcriptional regulator [Nonomuraea gerenzanensis]|uniref:Transcriptional regulator, MarR family n=1 Tax=Nonomuraea gerenzanensis TaxID=93944 RepID=A0A1M4EIE0_9ACTN|nr:helix-turn-helix domain-containing protein [Nonomuraea gerenzanensis]UBU10159.1 MarR family transcriptional regulator [Nonomuraea gerenzanensis]SBO98534.1 Transcriptional regulator, MarR family [Nonomuraea gerenzanensis]